MVEVRSCRFNLESHVVVRLIVFVEQDEIYQVPMIPRVSLRITPWNAMRKASGFAACASASSCEMRPSATSWRKA